MRLRDDRATPRTYGRRITYASCMAFETCAQELLAGAASVETPDLMSVDADESCKNIAKRTSHSLAKVDELLCLLHTYTKLRQR